MSDAVAAKPPVFLPKTFTAFKGYAAAQLGRDCLAGLTVGMGRGSRLSRPRGGR